MGGTCMTAQSYPGWIKEQPRSVRVDNWQWMILIDHPVFIRLPIHNDDPNVNNYKQRLCYHINKHIPGTYVLPNLLDRLVAFSSSIKLPSREFLECLSMFGTHVNSHVYPRLTIIGQKTPYENMLFDISCIDSSLSGSDPNRVLNNSWDLAYHTNTDKSIIEAVRYKQIDSNLKYEVEQKFLFGAHILSPDYYDNWIGGSANLIVDDPILTKVKIYPKLYHIIKAYSKTEYNIPQNVNGLRKTLESMDQLYHLFKSIDNDIYGISGTRYEYRIFQNTLADAFQFLCTNLQTPSHLHNYIGISKDNIHKAYTCTGWSTSTFVDRLRDVLVKATSFELHLRRDTLPLLPIEKTFVVDLLTLTLT